MLIEPFAEPLVARSTAESGAGRVAIAKQLQTGSITNKKDHCRAIGRGTRVAIAKQLQMGSIKTKRRPFAEPKVAERGWRLRSNNNGLN